MSNPIRTVFVLAAGLLLSPSAPLAAQYCTPADARQTITLGETRRGTLSESDCRGRSIGAGNPLRQVYRVEVERPTTVVMHMAAESFSAAIDLHTAAGEEVDREARRQVGLWGQRRFQPSEIRATLEPGTYYLYAGPNDDRVRGGNYTLRTQVIPDDVLTGAGQAFGELRPSGRQNAGGGNYDEWRFLGRAGYPVTFVMRGASFTPWVEIGHYHADGAWHSRGTAAGVRPNERINGEFQLTETGEFVLRAGSVRGGGSGLYAVFLGGGGESDDIPGPRRSLPRPEEGQAAFNVARAAFDAKRYAEAAAEFARAYEFFPDAQRPRVSFFHAFSIYKQAEEIARANTAGEAAPARRAAALFREVIMLLERHPGSHDQYDQVLSAARQYLANQEAIAAAATPR